MRPSAKAIHDAVSAHRAIVERLFAELAACNCRPGPGITRDTYGPGENLAHAVVGRLANELGLEVSSDAAVNTYMTLPGADRRAPRVMIGSHLDSVPHGGNFDGAAGVVAGLATLATLRGTGCRPRCDITVMGIRAEESVWFEASYIGSRAALGTLPPQTLEARRIDTKRTLAEHMTDCGADVAAIRAGHPAIDRESIAAFLELHIEQAPSLVEADLPLAVGTCIPGHFRYPNARIVGRYDHVGTPRRFRRDAVVAASELATALDGLWAEYDAMGVPAALTLGRFHTDAAAHGLTTVPGELHFSLDVRAYAPEVLAALGARFNDIVARVERARRVEVVRGVRTQAPISAMDPRLMTELEVSAHHCGIPTMRLHSPASHDAAMFAAASIPTAMLFVRNEHGSHNPREHMTIDDLLAGVEVLTAWLLGGAAASAPNQRGLA